MNAKNKSIPRLAAIANLRRTGPSGQVLAVSKGRKNPLFMGFAKRLTRTRERAGLTYAQLSRLADCDNVTVASLERRGVMPGIEMVEKVAAALGVSPIWLAYGPEGDLPFRQKQEGQFSLEIPEPKLGRARGRSRFLGCGDRLAEMRYGKRLALADVAIAANLSSQAISVIQRGKSAPKIDTLEWIAVALDVAPGWLAYGPDENDALPAIVPIPTG